jgi:hypothetical protein
MDHCNTGFPPFIVGEAAIDPTGKAGLGDWALTEPIAKKHNTTAIKEGVMFIYLVCRGKGKLIVIQIPETRRLDGVNQA